MPVKKGDTVSVHYTGTLDDGSVFDSSRERDPLVFKVGSGQVIAGFDSAVMDKEVGDTVKTRIEPRDAYGEVDEEYIFTVDRSQVPDNIPLEIGLPLTLSAEDGRRMDVTIAAVDDKEITLDANHPLAGKALTFDIEIVEIK